MAGQTDAQAPLLALCTSSDGHLSMYLVSFNSLLYFQRYASTSFLLKKIEKGSNAINTGSYSQQFHLWPSISVLSFIYFSFILLEMCSRQCYYRKT